jgi:phosphoglycolate phosphatase-like HAD superfamily hydrolase
MAPSTIWLRPDLRVPPIFDTVFFDVDGVLIKTTDSFRATDILVTEYVVGKLHGLDWGRDEGKALVTMADVEVFKQAGGYNDDRDMCYLLASLFTARHREWLGTPLAERSIPEWATLSRAAHLQGHGGREWVDSVVPASARLDYALIESLYHETYWGASEYRKRFGREPRYLPDFAGLVQHEEMLYQPDFPTHLRNAGIMHMGLITGRIGPEVDSALERMEAYSGERWWQVVVAADKYAKPDPQALRYAIAQVGTRGGLYIGDTADDFDLVQLYRESKREDEPPILATIVAHKSEVRLYQERGADLIVSSVEDLRFCADDDSITFCDMLSLLSRSQQTDGVSALLDPSYTSDHST